MTLAKPTVLSQVAITVSPWDRPLRECEIAVSDVISEETDCWTSIPRPGTEGQLVQAPAFGRFTHELDIRSWPDAENIAYTYAVKLPIEMNMHKVRRVRFTSGDYRGSRVLAVWAFSDVRASPCFRIDSGPASSDHDMRRGVGLLLLLLRRMLSAYDARRVVMYISGHEAMDLGARHGPAYGFGRSPRRSSPHRGP